MSLLNGLNFLGSGLNTFATDVIKDEELKQAKMPLLNAAPPTPVVSAEAPTPVAPAPNPKAGPRMPDGANPYSGPHAQALWQAERAIVGPESGGKANAQNPVSSAGGLYQIINPTWDAAMRKLGLPVASSDAERNTQKYNPDLNTSVMRAINSEAAEALSAKGLPVTLQNLQAAHRLGPAGAIKAIKTAMDNPDAPLLGSGLAADAVRGNGDISRLTVGQFLQSPYPRSSG